MFIAAGLHTILKYIETDEYKKLIEYVTPNGLISYGLYLEKRSKNKQFCPITYYKKSSEDIYKSIKSNKHAPNIKWMIDSGGYQVSIGYLPKNLIHEYIKSYHLFLNNEYKNIDEAFTLDIPISGKFFKDFDTAYKVNKDSYIESSKLKKEIRDKMLFVSHFRTINNFELYNRLIYEDRLIDNFKRFSIGGLVVGQSGINKMPINLYTIGFLQIILYFVNNKDKKLPKIRFHVLGASDHKSVIFFHLLKEASKYMFEIDLDLSFDSSAIFKRFQRARMLSYFNEELEISREISAKEKDLYKVHPVIKKTNLEIILAEIERMYNDIGLDFDISKYDTLYDDSGTFKPELRIPLTLLEAYQIKKFNDFANKKAKELFNIFLHDPDQFRSKMLNLLVNIHKKGNMTDVLKQQANVYKTSLEALFKFETIHDLENYMYSYNSVTDSEYMGESLAWDL